MATEFKIGDRVRRNNVESSCGTVESVRMETVKESISTAQNEPPAITVTVHWDNGTLSHFIPDALVKI